MGECVMHRAHAAFPVHRLDRQRRESSRNRFALCLIPMSFRRIHGVWQ